MPKKLTLNEFIEKSKSIHGNKYDYSKVEYYNVETKVCIICPTHGEFWQKPSMHLQGQGCRKCYGNEKMTKEKFVEKAKRVHGDKYDYSKVEYSGNNKTKVCIICPTHGEFWQKPNCHLNGCGCRKCSYDGGRGTKKTLGDFVKKSKEIHNDKYDYSKVNYINSKTKVCIICPTHGEFWQKPNNHLQGQGCPHCKSYKLEKEIEEWLESKNIEFIKEKRFEWLGLQRLDFYLPKYNVAIECQGIQHYKPTQFHGIPLEKAVSNFQYTKKMDETKSKLCAEHKLPIIYYSTKEIKNLSNNENLITDKRIIFKKLREYEENVIFD